MDEGIETRQDTPAFILNALKQLISLKSNITSIDDFHNDVKQINFGVNTDSTDFANKVKEFLDNLQIQVSDINNTFITSYETFVNEKGTKNTETCKRKCDTNSNSSGVTEEKTDIFANNTIENSDSDIPLATRLKSSKQKKNENSESDTNLQKQKIRKRRRKRRSSRNISESDNTESNSNTSHIQNIMFEETLESEEQIKLKSKITNKEDDKCKANNDSDKENTKNINTKPKEILIENHVQSETTAECINSDFDSEKETSKKVSIDKAKKVVESNTETDSGMKKSTENKEQVIENKTKKLTESDTDSDLNISKTKSDKLKNKKSKIVNDSDEIIITNADKTKKQLSDSDSDLNIRKSKVGGTKHKKSQKSNEYITNFESDTDKSSATNIDKTKIVVSDNDTEKRKYKSDDLKNKKSKTVNDSDSNETIITKVRENKTKKVTESDTDSDLNNKKSKSDDLKNKKSKIINDADSNETIITNADKTEKEILSDSDSDLNIRKSKVGGTKHKKCQKSNEYVTNSELDTDKSSVTNIDKTKTVVSDSDTNSENSKSKSDDLKNKKSKTVNDSDSNETIITKGKENITKVATESNTDSDLNVRKSSRKSKVGGPKHKKRQKSNKHIENSESDTDKSSITNIDKTKNVAVSNSDTDSEKSKSKSDDLKNKKSKFVNDSSDTNKIITNANKIKKCFVSDIDSESAKSKSNDGLKHKKKYSKTRSDSEKSKFKSDDLINKKICRIVNDSDSDSDENITTNANKTKEFTVSDSDSNSVKNKSKSDELKNKKKDKINSDSEESKSTKIYLKNKKKSKIVNDSNSDSAKSKSKSDYLKNKKSKIINDSESDSDENITTNLNKTKECTVSDSDSDSVKNELKNKKKDKINSNSEESKSTSVDLKNNKKTKIINDSDSDSAKSKSKSDYLNNKKKYSKTDSSSESSKSKSNYLKNKQKSKTVSDYASDETIIINADKTRIVSVSDTDLASERKKSETDDSNKKKDNNIRESNCDKDNSDDSDKANTTNKVNHKAASIESDSDSYLDDPRSIIEKYKKSLDEKRNSGVKTKEINVFDFLKESHNPETNDNVSKNTSKLEESVKGSKKLDNEKNSKEKKDTVEENSDCERSNVSLIFNLSTTSDSPIKINEAKKKTDDTVSDDSTNDNKNIIITQNDNSQQIKVVVNDEDKNTNIEKEVTPKVGLIKCIDISKLLDPKVKNIQKSPTKLESSVIILSSSESETESKSERQKQKLHESNKNKKNSEKFNKTGNSKNKVKHEEKSNKKSSEKDKNELKNKEKTEIQTIDSDSSSTDRKRRLRFNNKKEKVSNKSFEQFRKLRQRRLSKKTIVDTSSSSSSNDSDSSDSSIKSQNMSDKSSDKSNNKRPRKEKIFEIDPNYDHRNDIKFKSECNISLPRIPVEKLKAHYLQGREDAEINRLTNMKSLKRTRQQKGTSSSSDNDAKTVKKRGKLQQPKKVTDDEEQSEHSNDSMSDVPIIQENKKDAKIPIPEDLLDSDGDSNKHSASSDDEDKDKKKSKNDDKEKSGKMIDKEKEKDNAEENGKDSEKQNEDKEKKKWRNDPLLRGKLSASDSEDELIRFKNKKNKIADDIRSEPEEETIVSKKSKTKKQLKRIARRLGSDVSSSEEDKDEYKKSDSENENSDKSDKTSDSEEDINKKKPVRRRIKRIKDSEESSDGEAKKKKKEEDDLNTRKKIRHVWSKDSLADSTKEAAKEEQERKKRIADRQKLYNEIYDNKLDLNAEVDKVVLDFNEETKEELLSVHPDLVKKLKPHQAQGVQFMWTACFESLERAQNTEGSGCILAHCMGLGKTLQVITLIHTLLCNTEDTKVKTILVVCPLSTVLNWVSEFKKWLDDIDGEQVNVFDLVQYKQNYERLYQMQDWMKFGGVMVMGYDMFRNLSNPKGKRMSKKLINGFNRVLLEPGPDLVVCDEGHLLKNEKTGISIAMNRLKTLRRIVLTGTPLQNNLKEYFCMVQFVKPNLLGTYKEYLNRFVNPITNGQYTDSTLHDIQIMRKRAHVLHKMLDAVVERRDYNVLAPFLPPKHEYVLFVSLTAVQIELYREYLTKFSRNTNVKGTSYLFQDFQELQRICIHPRVLLDKSNQDKLRREMDDDDSEGSLKDFIDDDDSDKSASSSNESSTGSDSDSEKKPTLPVRRTRANPGNADIEEPELFERSSREEWWSKFCQGDELDNICHSSKIKLLFDILHQCEMIGDKVLVFSQSLYSLNLIEYFLAKVDEATQSGDTESLEKVGGHTASWAIGLDYFRMDGSTSCDNRATWCKTFNNDANTRARLFLISTRAGGLGINLVAANRVIIFDVSWNPSFDIQSIYRVYRFGQTKPCYIYRFVTMGTMENKIYERQVTKQAISKRVIDEQQIDRHYNQTDLAELYAFIPVPDEERPTPLVPKDRLFADLLQTHDKQIFKYHEHNSLLEDKADEGLNEEERQAAWEEFENEKTAPKFNLMQTMVRNGMFETLRILVQEDNNGWTPAQINNILPAVVQRISEQVARGDYSMYRRVEERHEIRVLEQRRMQMIYQQYMQQLRSASGGAPMTPADMNKLAQMFSAYNQTLATQQQMQPRPQIVAGSSAAVSFTQGDPPPLMTPAPPIPHPAVNEVVELND